MVIGLESEFFNRISSNGLVYEDEVDEKRTIELVVEGLKEGPEKNHSREKTNWQSFVTF